MAAPRFPDPRRLLVDHVIGLHRFENGLRRRVEELLRRAFQEINLRLLTQYDGLTRLQRARQLALFARTREMLGASYAEVTRLTRGRLFDLGRLEASFAERVLRATMGPAGVEIQTTRLTEPQVRAIVDFPVQGLRLGEWWEAQGKDAALQVRRQIQLGLMQGETTPQLVRRIVDPVRPGGGGVAGQARRNAAAIVRTSVTAVSAGAQQRTFEAQDPGLTSHYQYVATLDDRTTVICASLDGQVFRYDDPEAPRPPQHINCRSTIIPVIDWRGTGLPPAGDLVPVQRAAMGGPTTARSYEAWLHTQPVAVQEEVLGVAKARLFREGRVTLRDLLRDDGTELTLAELAQRLGLPVDAIAA